MRKLCFFLGIILLCTQLLAQQRVISGKVSDDKGTPIANASVLIKGSSNGTTTKDDGTFSIAVPPGTRSLVISSVNAETKEVSLGNNSVFDVRLITTNKSLEEVVIVAYGQQTRKSLTGSATTVKLSLLDKAPRSSVQESLQGNVPGVQVANGSGQPGSVPSVRIRGVGSFNAGSSPLYVIDGIPVVSGDLTGYNTNTIAALNSSDIESFTVLKDAAASSLYGSRAGNGVILITTKGGRPGKTSFNASAQSGINLLTIPKNDYPLNTRQMLELLREGWANSGRDPALFNTQLTARAIDTTVNTNWIDALTRNGNYKQADLSVSGGNDKTTFYLSGGLYQSQATQKGVDYNRVTTRLALTHKATDRLSINGRIGLSYQKSNTALDAGNFANPIRSLYRLQPWLKVYNADGSYDLSYNSTFNPVAVIDKNVRQGKSYSVLSTVGGAYDIYKGLSFETKAGADVNYAQKNLYYSPDFGDGRNNGGLAEQASALYFNWISTNLLKYKTQFGVDHKLDVLVGYEAQKTALSSNDAQASNLLPGSQLLANASKPEIASSTETANSINSILSNANYNFKGKYNLSASFRRDGSSRFGSAKRYGNFWSVGASWNIQSEKFMQNVGFLSLLRLRASYGTNGNQDFDDFGSRALYAVNGYEGSPGYVFSQFGNSLLTWEENKPLNIGIDFGILKNRVVGTIEYYQRKTSNLLLNVPVSATNGVTSYNANVGGMQNKGFEFVINSKNIVSSQKDGFTWETDFNLSTLENKVTSLTSPIVSSPYRRDVGKDFYSYYLPGYAGVNPANGEAIWYTDESKKTTTNVYGNAGRFYNGKSALPKFYGGLTNSFSLKGITLSFQFYYNYGNQVYDNWFGFTNSDGASGFSSTGKISRYSYDHRWRQPGDITNAPKINYLGGQTGLSNQVSTRFLFDGDYIRLRDISLAYDLPARLLSHAKISSARVYIRANNLYTFVKDKRLTFDPEVPITGDLNQRPPLFRTLLAGIDISF